MWKPLSDCFYDVLNVKKKNTKIYKGDNIRVLIHFYGWTNICIDWCKLGYTDV